MSRADPDSDVGELPPNRLYLLHHLTGSHYKVNDSRSNN